MKCIRILSFSLRSLRHVLTMIQLFLFFLQMAASTADCNVMDKELDALKSQKQIHKVTR